MGMFLLRGGCLTLVVAMAALSARGDDILFIGNSFTFASQAPEMMKNGGVPKLVEEIARAEGKQVTASAVTMTGQDWSYHLAQPSTAQALTKTWNWVVLQDYSTRPTSAGNVEKFMQDGETFSDRIATASPKAGIILYETWARPEGAFYKSKPGQLLGTPEKMMAELHKSYGDLAADLAARNPNRQVRVALVGTAFAASKASYPGIVLDAKDQHHATADGYYLAALVIYETIYHDSVKGAPTQFFKGAVTIPADEAGKMQEIADKVAGGGAN